MELGSRRRSSRTIHPPPSNRYGYGRGSNRDHKSCLTRRQPERAAFAKLPRAPRRRRRRRNAYESARAYDIPGGSLRPAAMSRPHTFTRRYARSGVERARSSGSNRARLGGHLRELTTSAPARRRNMNVAARIDTSKADGIDERCTNGQPLSALNGRLVVQMVYLGANRCSFRDYIIVRGADRERQLNWSRLRLSDVC